MLFHPCLRKLLVVTRFFVAAVAGVPPLLLNPMFLALALLHLGRDMLV